MPTDPLHDLRAAAQCYGQQAVGTVVRLCKLFDEKGRKVAEVEVPACSGRAEAMAPEVKPGWDFSRTVPRFDGTECAIHGRPLAVLRMLAEADGPVPVVDLRAAWDGYQAGDSTIRDMVAELKKKLKKLFPAWESDMIVSTGAGYSLEFR